MKVKSIDAWILIILLASVFTGCGPKGGDTGEACAFPADSLERTRGVYHWKTAFNLTEEDQNFIQEHQIGQLYVRMFDVGMEDEWTYESSEVVPLGTTVFNSPVPQGCEVIPTVYITLKALRAYEGREKELADLIVERVYAMASWNDLGDVKELQYDCDWTKETRPAFEQLCLHTRNQLAEKGAILSGTIRLHQIEEAYYPFDKGVVMIYNTGSIYDVNATNSIIDYDDVYKYLSVERRVRSFLEARKENCPVMQMAYPAYGWGVVYDLYGNFKRLVSRQENYEPHWSEDVRWETSEIADLMKVKGLVDSTIGQASCGNVIYHLDTENLTKYTSDEIEGLYN